jgi:hypothetical protein
MFVVRRKTGVVLSTMLRPRTQEAPMGIDAPSTLGETCIIRDMTVDVPMEVMLEGGSARHTLDIGSLDHVSFTMVRKEAIHLTKVLQLHVQSLQYLRFSGCIRQAKQK